MNAEMVGFYSNRSMMVLFPVFLKKTGLAFIILAFSGGSGEQCVDPHEQIQRWYLVSL
jgi:hypothetical protein